MFRLSMVMLMCAAPVAAQQAFSRSMVECYIILDEVQQSGMVRRAPPQVAEWSAAFYHAAIRQAAAEGIADPAAYVDATQDELDSKWRGRFGNPALLPENLEWIEYCGKFGRSQGVISK